jgi:hypothetical protein
MSAPPIEVLVESISLQGLSPAQAARVQRDLAAVLERRLAGRSLPWWAMRRLDALRIEVDSTLSERALVESLAAQIHAAIVDANPAPGG